MIYGEKSHFHLNFKTFLLQKVQPFHYNLKLKQIGRYLTGVNFLGGGGCDIPENLSVENLSERTMLKLIVETSDFLKYFFLVNLD